MFNRDQLKLVIRILNKEYKETARHNPFYALEVDKAKQALIDYVGEPRPILPKLGHTHKEVDIMAVTDDYSQHW